MENNEKARKCLCGEEPYAAQKDGGYGKLFKYRCPRCAGKELPWLGQWHDCGALQEWNRIAAEKNYRRRTLDYNESGICVSEPYKVLEWRQGHNHIEIRIYLDNGIYYCCCGCWFGSGGWGSGLGISDPGFQSLELLKAAALKEFRKPGIAEGLKKKAEKLLAPETQELTQGMLF